MSAGQHDSLSRYSFYLVSAAVVILLARTAQLAIDKHSELKIAPLYATEPPKFREQRRLPFLYTWNLVVDSVLPREGLDIHPLDVIRAIHVDGGPVARVASEKTEVANAETVDEIIKVADSSCKTVLNECPEVWVWVDLAQHQSPVRVKLVGESAFEEFNRRLFIFPLLGLFLLLDGVFLFLACPHSWRGWICLLSFAIIAVYHGLSFAVVAITYHSVFRVFNAAYAFLPSAVLLCALVCGRADTPARSRWRTLPLGVISIYVLFFVFRYEQTRSIWIMFTQANLAFLLILNGGLLIRCHEVLVRVFSRFPETASAFIPAGLAAMVIVSIIFSIFSENDSRGIPRGVLFLSPLLLCFLAGEQVAGGNDTRAKGFARLWLCWLSPGLLIFLAMMPLTLRQFAAGSAGAVFVVFVNVPIARQIREIMKQRVKVADLRHRLETPLFKIRNAFEDIGRAVERKEQVDWAMLEDAVRIGSRSREEVAATIDTLNDRQESNELGRTSEDVDINALIADAIREVEERHADRFVRDVRIVRNNSSQKLPVNLRAHPHDLQRVLYNVIMNAVEAIEGSGIVTVGVGEVKPMRYSEGIKLEISISDTGRGIPAGFEDRVFEAGVSTKSRPGGRGNGLYFAKQTLLHFGGTIEHRPRESGGTTFYIHLRASPLVAGEGEIR